jgi:hypothetical protein
MELSSIFESIESGEFKPSTLDLINLVCASLTKDDVIDCDKMQEVITGLQGVKKTAKEEFKALKKELDSAAKADIAVRGKAYFESLPVGAPISWVMTSGKVMTGTVGVQKKGAKTAHVILNEIPADSTAKNPKPDRYAKFHSIIVPEDFVMETKSEQVA